MLREYVHFRGGLYSSSYLTKYSGIIEFKYDPGIAYDKDLEREIIKLCEENEYTWSKDLRDLVTNRRDE